MAVDAGGVAAKRDHHDVQVRARADVGASRSQHLGRGGDVHVMAQEVPLGELRVERVGVRDLAAREASEVVGLEHQPATFHAAHHHSAAGEATEAEERRRARVEALPASGRLREECAFGAEQAHERFSMTSPSA